MSDNGISPKSEATPHPVFNEGDICFISNDEVLFKLDKEALLKYNVSAVLRNMLELPLPFTDSDSVSRKTCEGDTKLKSKPISMDCSSGALEGFLSILMTPIPMLPPSTLEDLYKVLKLCHQYECKKEYTDKVRQRLSETATEDRQRWEVIAEASKLDDRQLGKMVLARFDRKKFQESYESGIDNLTCAWRGKILASCQDGGQSIQVIDYVPFCRKNRCEWRQDYGWPLRPAGEWRDAFKDFDSDWL